MKVVATVAFGMGLDKHDVGAVRRKLEPTFHAVSISIWLMYLELLLS